MKWQLLVTLSDEHTELLKKLKLVFIPPSIRTWQTTDGYIWAAWLHSEWGECAHYITTSWLSIPFNVHIGPLRADWTVSPSASTKAPWNIRLRISRLCEQMVCRRNKFKVLEYPRLPDTFCHLVVLKCTTLSPMQFDKESSRESGPQTVDGGCSNSAVHVCVHLSRRLTLLFPFRCIRSSNCPTQSRWTSQAGCAAPLDSISQWRPPTVQQCEAMFTTSLGSSDEWLLWVKYMFIPITWV